MGLESVEGSASERGIQCDRTSTSKRGRGYIVYCFGLWRDVNKVDVSVSCQGSLEKEVAKDIIGRVYSLDMTLSNITTVLSIVLNTCLGDRFSNSTLMLVFASATMAISLYGSSRMKMLDQGG